MDTWEKAEAGNYGIVLEHVIQDKEESQNKVAEKETMEDEAIMPIFLKYGEIYIYGEKRKIYIYTLRAQQSPNE